MPGDLWAPTSFEPNNNFSRPISIHNAAKLFTVNVCYRRQDLTYRTGISNGSNRSKANLCTHEQQD